MQLATDTQAAYDAVALVRTALADDLDTPTALAVIDRWATTESTNNKTPGKLTEAGTTIHKAVDALLGVKL